MIGQGAGSVLPSIETEFAVPGTQLEDSRSDLHITGDSFSRVCVTVSLTYDVNEPVAEGSGRFGRRGLAT